MLRFEPSGKVLFKGTIDIGQIKEFGKSGYAFVGKSEVYTANELRQIAQKIDELNAKAVQS